MFGAILRTLPSSVTLSTDTDEMLSLNSDQFSNKSICSPSKKKKLRSTGAGHGVQIIRTETDNEEQKARIEQMKEITRSEKINQIHTLCNSINVLGEKNPSLVRRMEKQLVALMDSVYGPCEPDVPTKEISPVPFTRD